MINYDQLWDYFQEEDGIDIYARFTLIYGSAIKIIMIKWSEMLGLHKWSRRIFILMITAKEEDLPEIVEFISEGGSIEY